MLLKTFRSIINEARTTQNGAGGDVAHHSHFEELAALVASGYLSAEELREFSGTCPALRRRPAI